MENNKHTREASPKMLALKIDVDTFKGTKIGVPNLLGLLKKHQADATFLFSLGPDHTGRAIKRVFRKGFLSKVSRTSVVANYGFPTLLYGTVLPGPDIGKRCAAIMRQTAAEGFETGIHTWDHVLWQDNVITADAAWAKTQMERAQSRYTDIFKTPSRTHGAAGWQMSHHALRLTQSMGFDYCSDGRGQFPHFPMWNGELIDCPQLPSTMPTLDEIIGLDGVTETNVAEKLLALTPKLPLCPSGHVFTLHAELEGMRLLSQFEALLVGWREQGYTFVSTAKMFETLNRAALPYAHVSHGEIPGRSGSLLVQGAQFLHSTTNQ
jgi:undecaprenyl phosphate-alpha-L-ara4FN deformylase